MTPRGRSSKPTLIGTAIGGGAGAAIGFAISQINEETVLARADIMTLAFGGIGAAVGALIGRSFGDARDEVLYQAP